MVRRGRAGAVCAWPRPARRRADLTGPAPGMPSSSLTPRADHGRPRRHAPPAGGHGDPHHRAAWSRPTAAGRAARRVPRRRDRRSADVAQQVAMPPPRTRRSVVEHDALPGATGAAARPAHDARARRRRRRRSPARRAVGARTARARARRPAAVDPRHRSTPTPIVEQVVLAADDHRRAAAVDVDDVALRRRRPGSPSPRRWPIVTSSTRRHRRRRRRRPCRPRRRRGTGCGRRGTSCRPPVEVMKHTSWLSGLAAVRRPSVRRPAAAPRPCRGRRPGTACGPASPGRACARRSSGPWPRRRRARACSRPSVGTSIRAWWPVATASKPSSVGALAAGGRT